MAARKRKKTSTRARGLSALQTLMGAREALNRSLEYNELEKRYLFLEKEHANLRDKIVSLLSKDQIEAAKICGCSPEIYCLEWIDIVLKSDLKKYTPSFGEHISNFRSINGGAI